MTRLDDPEDAHRLLSSWTAGSHEALAHAERVSAAIEAVRATVWSPGREVRVTVDAAGLLREVEFSDRALRASALTLGPVVTRTITAARAQVAEAVEEAAAVAAVGTIDPMLDSLRQSTVHAVRAGSEPDRADRGRFML
jgi:hypothetical protein